MIEFFVYRNTYILFPNPMDQLVIGASPRHNAARRISVGSSTMMSAGGNIASHLGHSSPALHQQLHPNHYTLPKEPKQHHQSTAAFTVQSAAGSAALLMNHSSSTIIFPPPTSFGVSPAMPVAATAMTTATAGGQQLHQHHSQQTSPHYAAHTAQQQQLQYYHRHSKRKSAVELLAESKPFYVKSEKVLDRQQHQIFYANRPSGNSQQSPLCKCNLHSAIYIGAFHLYIVYVLHAHSQVQCRHRARKCRTICATTSRRAAAAAVVVHHCLRPDEACRRRRTCCRRSFDRCSTRRRWIMASAS